MIWHFFEVWVLMLAAFAVGCPIGALTYRALAGSPLAELQGGIADVVGDVVDGIKSRLGIGPVWRPEYRRIIERSAHDDYGEAEEKLPYRPLLSAPEPRPAGGVIMIADQSARAPVDEDAEVDEPFEAPAPFANRIENQRLVTADSRMARPVTLSAPRNRVPDDLQRIRGIGRRIERRLNALGIYHFGQIAAWTPAEIRWVANQLAFPDRVERDDWVGQAIVLAAGGRTGFVKSADRRRARRREQAFEDAIAAEADQDGAADAIEPFDAEVQAADDDMLGAFDDAGDDFAGEEFADDEVAERPDVEETVEEPLAGPDIEIPTVGAEEEGGAASSAADPEPADPVHQDAEASEHLEDGEDARPKDAAL